jgi:RNA polymerase sigma-70 factor (ECF subfamily)
LVNVRGEESDDRLLSAAAAGDADSYAAFYRRHLSSIIAYFLRRTGDREVTADLTAEVFAAALLACPRYRAGERPALAWLYGIAANKLRESRRHGRVENNARRRLALPPLALTDADLERVEELAAMSGEGPALAAVDSLPSDQREAVLARVVSERDYRDIAHELRCSETVVRKRVSRGLRTLRARMEKAP